MRQINKKNIKISLGVSFVLLALTFNSCAIKKQPEHKAIVTEAFVDSTFMPTQWTEKRNRF